VVRNDVREVLTTFLRLGCTSFGGPIAHLQYFRRTLVIERGWLDDGDFARIVAFCSVLPGPTSSQVGMLIGFLRAGAGGAFAAWLGFTAPSAILMACAAAALIALGGQGPPWFGGLLSGLFAAAAAVVAAAVIGLARSLCIDLPTVAIAIGSAAVAIALRPIPGTQWVPIAAGALAGIFFARRAAAEPSEPRALVLRVSRTVAAGAAILACVLLAITLLPRAPLTAFLGSVVRAGALVFGGGHVVLPFLQSMARDHLIDERMFFAGYGVAQAMPGPLFTFASFLGYANLSPLHGVAGALTATVLIFAPSFALIFALAPVWNRITTLPHAASALRGANASVVGLLAAVFYDPILPSLWGSWLRIAIALAAYVAIGPLRVAPWIAVAVAALLGAVLRA
jgi:chromate transporter